ncbi:hypothetical protein [Frankia sp. AgW1.1]|uniref:hypothetical protein n=1 Tax=Frankia sp. AgW1.1 TaxID=1836971 RepID=UPI0019332B39|nr:hypothetical protein [Frankia sp. AgW1.1]MBL7487139.1 hypothetical protein [Frankia sp. AgW1.1]
MTDEHGTIAAYRRCPTKCADCKAAAAADQRRRYRLTAYGRPTTDLVDATPVHEHLARLRAADMSINRIAAQAGVPSETVDGITRRPSLRVRRHIAAAILSVQPDPAFVDAAPTWRLIHGMVAAGYLMSDISLRLGRRPGSRGGLSFGRRRVKASTAAAVRDLAEQCAITPGSSDAARRMAEQNGWQVAWLWEDLPCSQDSEAA